MTIIILFLISTSGIASKTNIKSFAVDAVEKGWAYFNRGDLETALKRFNQATIIDPKFALRILRQSLCLQSAETTLI